ncbi:MAG TPA: cell division protein FtsL [Candidatus Deferrimicrobiaceae bacterium]|jgi:cell division protein FtsL
MKKMVVKNGVCMLTHVRPLPRESMSILPEGKFRLRAGTIVLCIVAFSLFNVWITGTNIRIGYAVSSALDEKRKLQHEKDLLRTEMLALQTPSRIEALAKNTLGMVDPRMERLIP